MRDLIFDKPTIVLGSASPRRKEILEKHGIDFVQRVLPTNEDELNVTIKHEGVSKRFTKNYVNMLALEKQKPFRGITKNGAVITSDNVVWCGGRILEKPLTIERCREQQKFISGKTCYVFNSHAVYFNGKSAEKVKQTRVNFDKLPKELIETICNDPLSLDAAGFRIQSHIGPYSFYKYDELDNILGLYVPTVKKLLEKVGFNS